MEIGSNEKGNNCVMIIVGRVLIKFDNENDGDADDADIIDDDGDAIDGGGNKDGDVGDDHGWGYFQFRQTFCSVRFSEQPRARRSPHQSFNLGQTRLLSTIRDKPQSF